MPVEDRLRRGLEVNATSFAPEAESRLAGVHDRRRRRAALTAGASAAALASVVALLALAMPGENPSDRPQPAPAPSQQTTSGAGASWDGDTIPDSTWTKVVRRADLRVVGLGPAYDRSVLGSDGRLALTLRFHGGTWAQLGDFADGGPQEVGDSGTLTYDSGGRLVTTSNAPGCRGCTAALEWRIEGDRLDLAFVPGSGGRPFDPFERLMVEGTWHRVAPRTTEPDVNLPLLP